MDKCFALNSEGFCTALKKKKCKNCKFYRTDLDINNIEREIDFYSPVGKKNDYEIFLRK